MGMGRVRWGWNDIYWCVDMGRCLGWRGVLREVWLRVVWVGWYGLCVWVFVVEWCVVVWGRMVPNDG